MAIVNCFNVSLISRPNIALIQIVKIQVLLNSEHVKVTGLELFSCN